MNFGRVHVGKGLGVVLTLFFFPNAFAFVFLFGLGFIFDVFYENAYLPRLRAAVWRQNFSYHVVALHAKMAKVDGVVTPDEISAFREVCLFPKSEEEIVGHLYNEARLTSSGFESHAQAILILCKEDASVAQYVLETLLYVYHRAACPPICYDFIRAVSAILQVSEVELEMLYRSVAIFTTPYENQGNASASAHHSKTHANAGGGFKQAAAPVSELSKAYKLLGAKQTDSAADIKKLYRQKIKAFHPDKLRGDGASEADIQKAEEQMMVWNEAYDTVMSSFTAYSALQTKGK